MVRMTGLTGASSSCRHDVLLVLGSFLVVITGKLHAPRTVAVGDVISITLYSLVVLLPRVPNRMLEDSGEELRYF